MATVFTKSTAPDLTKSVVALTEDLFLTLGVKGFIYDAALSVTIPTIADVDSDSVAVTVTGVAVGDSVLTVDPVVALPTDCLLVSAYVSAADEVTFVFTTKEAGSGVTGAAKTFTIIILDRT